jgi:hypothetical protein
MESITEQSLQNEENLYIFDEEAHKNDWERGYGKRVNF